MMTKFSLSMFLISATSLASAADGEYGAIWSPNDQYIAYTKVDEQLDWEIVIKNIKTGMVRQLTDASGYDTDITWSPDGSKIAFTSSRSGNRDIYLADVESGKTRVLIEHSAMDNQPKWSPDGKSIAFLSQRNGLSQIFIYDVTSKAIRQLTNTKQPIFHPSWTDDGNTIVFDQSFSSGSQIYKVDVSSAVVSELYKGDGSNIYGTIHKNLLTFSSNKNGSWDIMQYDINQKVETTLIGTELNEMKAHWNSNHTQIAYSAQDSQGFYRVVTKAFEQ